MNRDTQPMGTSAASTGSSIGTEPAGLTQARKMGGA
jgi:hypothetical protein